MEVRLIASIRKQTINFNDTALKSNLLLDSSLLFIAFLHSFGFCSPAI